jgi:hypothetical protein
VTSALLQAAKLLQVRLAFMPTEAPSGTRYPRIDKVQ